MPGLAVARSIRAKNLCASSLFHWLGAAASTEAPWPQCGRISSTPDSASASGDSP